MDEINVLEYNNNQNYVIGNFVSYNNNIYECIKDTDGSQNPSNTEYWSIEIFYKSLEDYNYEYDDNNNIIESHYNDGDDDLDDETELDNETELNIEYNNYVPGEEYEIGDVVIYSDDNKIYICIKNTDGTQNPSNTEYWEEQNENVENEFEFVANKKTSISNLSTDIDYPSAKAVYEYINNQNFVQTTDLKYESFYNDWNITSFNNFCNSILNISTDNIGKVFLGSFSSSWVPDIPEEGRAVIEILDENYIHIILYTNNLQKYEYLFNNTNNSGWF